MFRHQGNSRNISHNKKIASLLSFVAGIVNVVGFLSVQRLTTNVTGHFAYFIDAIFKLEFSDSIVFFLYLFFFFLGSFVSSLLVEIMIRKNERYVFFIPTLIESFILFSIGIFGNFLIVNNANLIAYSLLFAMGLQNSLVTRISNAVVRTTHLTGLFTDLGIELSQLLFNKSNEQKSKLMITIQLRLRIIFYFFIGGISGGILFTHLEFQSLFVPAMLLLLGLYYDAIKYQLVHWKRKYYVTENR